MTTQTADLGSSGGRGGSVGRGPGLCPSEAPRSENAGVSQEREPTRLGEAWTGSTFSHLTPGSMVHGLGRFLVVGEVMGSSSPINYCSHMGGGSR